MSKIKIDLKEDNESTDSPNFGAYQEEKKGSVLKKVFKILAGSLVVVLLIGAIGGFFYWRHLKTTPQYSLALLINAARNDNQDLIEEVVDVDAVVDDFVPQVTSQAVELYGRGVDAKLIKQAMSLTAPILPVIKQRAKAELPELIRENTKRFEDIPFWAIAIGASRYLDITEVGDKAIIKSKIKNRPLEVEMKRNGDKWQIVSVKDEKIAKKIAGRIGQEIIGMARNKDPKELEKIGRDYGIDNVKDILKQAQDIFNK